MERRSATKERRKRVRGDRKMTGFSPFIGLSASVRFGISGTLGIALWPFMAEQRELFICGSYAKRRARGKIRSLAKRMRNLVDLTGFIFIQKDFQIDAPTQIPQHQSKVSRKPLRVAPECYVLVWFAVLKDQAAVRLEVTLDAFECCRYCRPWERR
ncbi:putative transmembrane protein [Toxoplasma gondii GT1]|uniref:Putative transmembrane protein n=1 Tax=Toxoplasma gondii (strain ATCC 50853 / GT1) TaxID=507601 RepID=S7W2M7_TOXGG|nr:putative transmembrane protein [Toxoplasma gondii GT1]